MRNPPFQNGYAAVAPPKSVMQSLSRIHDVPVKNPWGERSKFCKVRLGEENSPNRGPAGVLRPATPFFQEPFSRVSRYIIPGAPNMAVDRPHVGHLGKLVKAHYDELITEPLPPRLAALVERLNGLPAEQARDSEELSPDQTSDATGRPRSSTSR